MASSSSSPQLPPDLDNDTCPPHPGFFLSMCTRCSKFKTPEDDKSTIPFSYIHNTLRLSAGEIDRLRNEHKNNMSRDKKLVLVLDLDHTLIHSTLNPLNPKEEEKLLLRQAEQKLFKLEHIPYITKLRPFVHTFLERAHRKFELYIYTAGDRPYAVEIVKLLDPQNIYFDSRVISRSESTNLRQKSLDVVLLGAETSTLILDDTVSAWPGHKKNLILMQRYNYFKDTCSQFGVDPKSISELIVDESETEGVLASILGVLEHVHDMFFDPKLGPDFSTRDVRHMLRKIQQEILQGCKIAFGPELLEDMKTWNVAEQMGAECSREVDDSITHLVCSVDTPTKEADWATDNGKFLVRHGWIKAAYYLWRRPREEDYVVIISRKRNAEDSQETETETHII